MNLKRIIRWLLLICIILFLLILTWWAIAGGVHQLSHSNTLGQHIETVVQLLCGVLSFLTVSTYFVLKKWASFIRVAWIFSLVLTAGLSALVWGPPMPLIALLFAAVALLAAYIILWGLQRLSVE
ncbi:hypothetical protein [Rhodohalobacter barkolensis]|uniref:Uncharacterized protein n=1 Tax=Rhodohalobacter barkolensis TaxID=2053187 RepID=A0A2N0VLU3_9BACT|nr:hypothetical protein [Rhodohalobacter barkolensis]PKD45158.1 hypothetical protein CWD77_06815 [Rhodohalobacter barkolensis]